MYKKMLGFRYGWWLNMQLNHLNLPEKGRGKGTIYKKITQHFRQDLNDLMRGWINPKLVAVYNTFLEIGIEQSYIDRRRDVIEQNVDGYGGLYAYINYRRRRI